MSTDDSAVEMRQPPEAIRSREGQLDPFEWYAKMRQEAPVHFDEQRQTWDVFRYDDAKRVLNDHDAFTADRGQAAVDSATSTEDDGGTILETMIGVDPPEHERLRGFVNERFQPGSIRDYRSRIAELTDELTAQIEGDGQFDFVDEFAVPLPVIVIAELLGIPSERREQFKDWSDSLIARPDNTSASVERVQRQREQARKEMGEYFAELLEDRRTGDGDDLITLAATTEELSTEERIGFCMLLLLAGNITTTNLLTNAVWCFEEQGLMDAIRTGEIDRKNAIEEVLRYRSPVQSVRRIAAEDVELNGHHIQSGAIVTVWLGSANRDPEVFDAPESFRPERKPNRHVSFGSGVHYCLGAPLARLEADVALEGLFDRFDRIEVDRTDLRPLRSLYGLRSLPCEATPKTQS
ncbi:cytochrome P450 [Natrinema sp. 74]|uniref:cytochrome P450 n=1 Tax=Natrinema sp. 74 TaxID=3384159 RepID=UPI0038D3FE97